MGPASTTSGRSVAIERVSFVDRCRILLLPGDDDEPAGVQREGCAVETTEELDLAPALRPQHVEQLVGRVEPDLALTDQFRGALGRLRRRSLEPPPAGAPAARRGIELVLDADRRAAPAHPLFRRQRAHALVSVARIDDEGAAGLQRPPEAVEHEPDHAGDPLHVARGVGPGLDRLRDLGPRFAEEPLALEHEGHYIPVHDDPGDGRVRLHRRLGRARAPRRRRASRRLRRGRRPVARAHDRGAPRAEPHGRRARRHHRPREPPTRPARPRHPPPRGYWEAPRIPSSGFRPLTVYGPGRDFGLTPDPTLAMKAAVLGRPFQIRWGGSTDLIYTEDVARALLAAAGARLDGARVY